MERSAMFSDEQFHPPCWGGLHGQFHLLHFKNRIVKIANEFISTVANYSLIGPTGCIYMHMYVCACVSMYNYIFVCTCT